MLQAAEGEDVTAVILVAGGNKDKLPEIKWVKGKWNVSLLSTRFSCLTIVARNSKGRVIYLKVTWRKWNSSSLSKAQSYTMQEHTLSRSVYSLRVKSQSVLGK